MSAKDTLTILKNADLLKQHKRLEKLTHLSASDYSLLLDKLDQVAKISTTKASNTTRLNDLWLPYVSGNIFDDIPGYLFLFDKVYLLDPLYDYFVWLEQGNEKSRLIAQTTLKNVTGENTRYIDAVMKIMDETNYEHRLKQTNINKVNSVIEQYYKLQDLIENGALDFHYDMTSQENYPDAMTYFQLSVINDQLDNAINKSPDKIAELNIELSSNLKTIPQTIEDAFQFYTSDAMLSLQYEVFRLFYTSLNFKSIFPAQQCSNIDFGDEKNKHLFDKIIEFGSNYLDKDLVLNGIRWPQPEDELIFTMLSGIPPQELLTIREKERSALDNFRYGMQKKLLDIRGAVGTKDYSKLIKSFQLEQKKEVAEIKLLSEHINKKYFKQVTNNILIATTSAAAAILSASVAVNDPISLLGIGIGSAGATTGLSKLIETWIEYTSELDKMKEKDAYILWKAQSSKKKTLS